MFLIFILLFRIFVHHFERNSTFANKNKKEKNGSSLLVRTACSSGVVLGFDLALCGLA
jgi:hypothetical protein